MIRTVVYHDLRDEEKQFPRMLQCCYCLCFYPGQLYRENFKRRFRHFVFFQERQKTVWAIVVAIVVRHKFQCLIRGLKINILLNKILTEPSACNKSSGIGNISKRPSWRNRLLKISG